MTTVPGVCTSETKWFGDDVYEVGMDGSWIYRASFGSQHSSI